MTKENHDPIHKSTQSWKGIKEMPTVIQRYTLGLSSKIERFYQFILVFVTIVTIFIIGAITLTSNPTSDQDFVWWFYSTIIQLNGSILGIIIVVLSLSVILIPEKPIFLLKQREFPYIAMVILFLASAIFSGFIGLVYGSKPKSQIIYTGTFVLEILGIYALVMFLFELVRKFRTISKYKAEEIYATQLLKNLNIVLQDDYLILYSKKLVHFVEGTFESLVYVPEENGLRPSRKSGRVKIEYKGVLPEEGIKLIKVPLNRNKNGEVLEIRGVIKLADIRLHSYSFYVYVMVIHDNCSLKLDTISIEYISEEEFQKIKNKQKIRM